MPIIFGLLDFQLGNLKQVKNLGGGGIKICLYLPFKCQNTLDN